MACRWWADGGPLLVLVGSSVPHKKRSIEYVVRGCTPSDKNFWTCAWKWNHSVIYWCRKTMLQSRVFNIANMVPSKMLKPFSNFLTNHSKAVLLLWSLFVIGVSCHTVLYVPSSLVVTCWERTDLLAFLCVMFSCFFVLGQVWYLIVSIPDLCLLPYFLTLSRK